MRVSRTVTPEAYDAFISYSSAIYGLLARKLQHRLERFATPWYRPRAMRVFRDVANLASSDDLSGSIEAALASSRWLILLASPEAAKSVWVDRELQWWRDNRPTDRVCLVLVAGSLRWDDEAGDWDRAQSDAVPPAAYGMFAQQPRWVDLTSVRSALELDRANPVLQDVVAEIVAPISGRAKDELVGEHIIQLRRARRQLRGGVAGLASLTVASMVATIFAVLQAEAADRERRVAVFQRDVATSRQLAADAELATRRDPQLAALLSVAAMNVRDTPEARAAMVHQLAVLRRGSVFVEHYLSDGQRPVRGLAVGDRGRIVAVAGERTVLWDVESGTRIKTIPISARFVALAPGRDVLAMSDDDRVTVWDYARNRQLAMFRTGATTGPIAFSPDGRSLAVGGVGYTAVQIWDAVTFTLAKSLKFPRAGDTPKAVGTRAVQFSPDGSLLATDMTDDDGPGVTLWNLGTGTVAKSIGASDDDPCFAFSLAFSPDQRSIAAGCAVHSAAIAVWDTTSGAETVRLHAEGDVYGLAFSPDGRTLASADAGHKVLLWDVRSHTVTATLTAHTDEVNAVAFTPVDGTLVTGGADSNAIVWGWKGANALSSVPVTSAGADEATISFDSGAGTVAYDAGPDLMMWSTRDRRTRSALTGTGELLSYLADDKVLTARNGMVEVWSTGGGRQHHTLGIPRLTGDTDAGRPFTVSPDRRLLATPVADGKRVVVWDIAADKELAELPAADVSSLSIGPRNELLAIGEGNGSVVLWSIGHRAKKATLPIETVGGNIVEVALSPDGQTIATVAPAGQPQTNSGCFNCTVSLWDVRTSEKITDLAGHTVKPEHIAFSPDGAMLASAGWNETILWSVSQRAALATIAAGGPLSFSPDGQWLATQTRSGRIALWDVDPRSWRRDLCGIVGRDLTSAEWRSYLPDRAPVPICP